MANTPCQEVRLAEIPRSTVVSSNKIAKVLLESIGYHVNIIDKPSEHDVLESLKENQVDVFFGLSLPISNDEVRLYSHLGYLRTVAKNFAQQRIGLAVNDAGKKSIKDVSELAKDLSNTNPNIYVSNTDTAAILKLRAMIARNQFGTDHFRLVKLPPKVFREKIIEKADNSQITYFFIYQPSEIGKDLTILNDHEGVFGEKTGQNAQYTITRQGYLHDCRNLGVVLQNLKFDVAMLRKVELAMLNNGDIEQVVRQVFFGNQQKLSEYLIRAKTYTGKNALVAAHKHLFNQP